MTRDLKKTVVAFVATLAVQAALVWGYILAHGSFLDALRVVIVLAVIGIVFVLIVFAWAVLVVPSESERETYHDER